MYIVEFVENFAGQLHSIDSYARLPFTPLEDFNIGGEGTRIV